MIANVSLMWHAIRHTRPKQLFWRAHLLLKRWAVQGLTTHGIILPEAKKFQRRLASKQAFDGPPISPSPPMPIFAPRTATATGDNDGLMLCILNKKVPVCTPFNWHPTELEKGTRLELLNLHYMEYLEAVNHDWFVRLVDDWITQNRPGRPGYWLDSWNSYALSIRCVVWMQQFVVRVDALPKDFCFRMFTSLWEQIRFLAVNLESDIGGNHLLKNIKAQLWAGRFFTGSEAQKWTRRGQKLLLRELKEQILGDGFHYERSPSYHCQVFADLLECHAVLDTKFREDWLDKVLDHMAIGLIQTTHQDGLVSLFNDGGLHMAYTPSECMSVYSGRIRPVPKPEEHIRLSAAGYYGLRRQDSFFLIDCGEIAPNFLPAHGHGDILSFEWDVCGRRIIVDPGVFEYHPGQWRKYSRATRSHNTVTVQDEDQCQFWKAFRVGRRATPSLKECKFENGELRFEGSHDGFKYLPGGPIHVRRVRTNGDRVEVSDSIIAGKKQVACARLLLHPECKTDVRDSRIIITAGNVRVNFATDNEFYFEDAWWMPDFGVRHSTCQIIIKYGIAPCEGGFVLEREAP